MKKTLVAAVLAVLAVTTTACGNDADTAAKSISATMMKQQNQGASGGAGDIVHLQQNDADCIGKGLVDKIGTEKLQKYGVLNDKMQMNKSITSVKMSPQDADKAANTFLACTDVMKSMDKAIAESGTLDPKVRACIDKALTKGTVHDMFVAMFSGQRDQATKALTAKLMQCAMGSSPTG